VSAVTGAGLQELLNHISAELSACTESSDAFAADVPLLLRARHQRAVGEARSELQQFLAAIDRGSLPMSVAATHLRSSAQALESLVGVIGVDDVLDRVFSSFCVGK
jgi:tRNA modification GTPase